MYCRKKTVLHCLFMSQNPKPKKRALQTILLWHTIIIQWVNLNFLGSIQRKLTVSGLYHDPNFWDFFISCNYLNSLELSLILHNFTLCPVSHHFDLFSAAHNRVFLSPPTQLQYCSMDFSRACFFCDFRIFSSSNAKNTRSRKYKCCFFVTVLGPFSCIFGCFRVFAVFCRHCFLPIWEKSMSQKSLLVKTRTIHAREKSMLYSILFSLLVCLQ